MVSREKYIYVGGMYYVTSYFERTQMKKLSVFLKSRILWTYSSHSYFIPKQIQNSWCVINILVEITKQYRYAQLRLTDSSTRYFTKKTPRIGLLEGKK